MTQPEIALQIAKLILQANTDDRGLLLQQVAAYLRLEAQDRTALIFDAAAKMYDESN